MNGEKGVRRVDIGGREMRGWGGSKNVLFTCMELSNSKLMFYKYSHRMASIMWRPL